MRDKILAFVARPSYHVPVSPDVWFAFLKGGTQSLLLKPHDRSVSRQLATLLHKKLRQGNVANLEDIMVATVDLDELLLIVLPLTTWAQGNTQGLHELLTLFQVKGVPETADQVLLNSIFLDRKVIVC